MLGNHPIYPVLLAKDLAAAREFYHDKLGLELLTDSAEAIVLKCGDTQLSVTRSTVGTADEQTQAGWHVSDIRAEVAELRARGVEVENYDMPGLKTEDGVADIGFAWAAWIIDPGKNALGILQIKNDVRYNRQMTTPSMPGMEREGPATWSVGPAGTPLHGPLELTDQERDLLAHLQEVFRIADSLGDDLGRVAPVGLGWQMSVLVASMASLSLKPCPFGAPPKPVNQDYDPNTRNAILRCEHQPSHCWDLAGAALPACPP